MPITFDLKRDIRYNQGKSEGIVEGEFKGKLKGKIEEKQMLIIRLLKTNNYTYEAIANIAGTSLDFVEKTQKVYQKGLQMIENKKYNVHQIMEATGLMQEVVETYILK